jgi:hypothetical protein
VLAEKFMLFLETLISHADDEPRIASSRSPHVPITPSHRQVSLEQSSREITN